MDDKRALRELRHGSETALSGLIDRYTSYVSAVIYNVIGAYMQQADVEEATADVFVALWHNAGKIKPDAVKGWLGTVARNMAKNKLREIVPELPLEEDVLPLETESPETALEQRERQELVRQAVLQMEQPVREIFLRHYYYCQTVDRIAKEMGLNPSTVKSHLRRGREKLRAVLQDKLTIEGGTRR